MLGTDIAIDLGTYAVKVYVEGKGIVVNEPAVVAVRTATDEVLAVGSKAFDMLGRTSDQIKVIHPLTMGVISDFELARYMVNYYIQQLGEKRIIHTHVMPRAVVSLPCQITGVERRAIVNSVSRARVRRVYSIDEPVSAAMGAGVDVANPHGSLVIDVGAGATDMGVISLGGLSIARSIKTAGFAFDQAIIHYVRNKYDLIIGDRMAESCKIAAGGIIQRPEPVVCRIKGRDANTGLPAWVDVNSEELVAPLLDPAAEITHILQEMLEKTPPELLGDIYVDGIVMTGGSAKLYGLSQYIADKVKMPVHVAEDSDLCVALGAGKAIKYMDDAENKEYGVINPLSAVY
ncbi:MAG TPA: rod shape-determining protein [Ruminococcaceae bacterium]|nr:rod shape-determining protein [Oscillospiraceae bacterium]HCM23066.1 rod shape-determining protein [Oscillospiraceae bacterium]